MLGINGWEALVLLVVVLLVVGPDKLPEITRQVAGWLRAVREFIQGARETVKREIGEDVDLASLDPRQYDPRRVVREALFDEPPAKPSGSRPAGPRMWDPGGRGIAPPVAGAPFDDEAT
ncbi:MAG TPA: Sec-independent protein translocase TatB [Actinomycetales bacterium]|nr:Sec-independent protein translocase TatB [Actinomycetales bacterium]